MCVSKVTLSCCGIIAGCAISAVSRQANGVPFLPGLPYCRFADTDPQNILEPPTAVDICARSARGITSMIQKRLGKLRDILERVTLKQGKTHCGRGLITDPKAHVVTDFDRILNKISRLAWNRLRCR